MCSNKDLITALDRLQQTGAYQHEIRRRDRVEEQLEDLRKIVQSRRITLAPTAQAGEPRIPGFSNSRPVSTYPFPVRD